MSSPAERPVPCTASHTHMALSGGCADCGHASLVHPGMGNPGLVACLLCELAQARDDMREALGAVTDLHQALAEAHRRRTAQEGS